MDVYGDRGRGGIAAGARAPGPARRPETQPAIRPKVKLWFQALSSLGPAENQSFTLALLTGCRKLCKNCTSRVSSLGLLGRDRTENTADGRPDLLLYGRQGTWQMRISITQ